MESFFYGWSNSSPVSGANSNDEDANPPPAYPANDPLTVLDSIRRARAVAAATNAECDPAPPSPARSAKSFGSANRDRSNLENGCVEVDIDAGPIAYSGGGVADFLKAREEAENGGKSRWRELIPTLFAAASPKSKSGETNTAGKTSKTSPRAATADEIMSDVMSDGVLSVMTPPPPPPEQDVPAWIKAEEAAAAKSRRRRLCAGAACLVVLVGAAAAVGVVVGGGKKSNTAVASGSDVPDDFTSGVSIPDNFDNVGIPDEFGGGSSGNDNIWRPPSPAPRPSGGACPSGSNTFDAGYGCLGRCDVGQKCGEYGFFDAFYPNDDRPCPSMCCRNGRIELGAQDDWYQCCAGVANNLQDYRRAGSNVRRSCSPLF
jgi:hypothetical protein